ncbi:MAG: hypothetical protein ACN6OM_16730 [Alcaligenes nematophilus]|uniref:hypothetical protein n=1 Tax=Alcaligenes nematophilus TaxID=2994643 RepID=UPI003CFC28BA
MKIDARADFDFLNQNIETFSSAIQPLWHPLGFSSCIIKKEQEGKTLRVHFWPPNERRTKNPDWPIHTHAYALSSLILDGQLTDIQYEVEAGDEYNVYSVTYSNGNSEIFRTNAGLKIISKKSAIRSAGEQYRVERGIFHQSFVEFGKSTVTLVSLSEHSDEAPLVLGGAGLVSYPYDRTPFDRELFWSAVRKAISS